MAFTLTIVAIVIVLALCWRFLGAYMVAVYEGRAKWLTWLERPIYRVLRVDPAAEQTWSRYATSVIVFSGVALLLTYAIFRLQGHLPFNPSHFPGVRADTAWNTSVSFVYALAAAPAINFVRQGAAAPAACTGNATFPQAAAGNVCIYEAERFNTIGGTVNEVNRSGATIFINSTAGGGFFSFGTWAVTGS